LEEILKIMLRSTTTEIGSRNFQVYLLRNAGAEEVSQLLQDLFKGMATARRGLGGTPVVITADQRLNMVIVHGSRADREIVSGLMQALDSPDLPDSLAINQPLIVPVRNTDAGRILTILNSLYRTQLSSGGGRKQVAIPEGISAEVAVLLQQVNTATSGPILTLGVDTVTNAIIIMAPQQLREQVRTMVSQLDQAVIVEPGEEIAIIRLQDTSPERIQRALDMLLEQQRK
jgi:type II secretory pathway component GspD/PulD (secretin)